MIERFVSSLPFSLTGAQKKSIDEILRDLQKPNPMNRLLNGDVGSGKTVVAATASLAMTEAGYQTAIMAPTEVLARQHFESFAKLFKNQNVSVALLTNAYQLQNGHQSPVNDPQEISDDGLLMTDDSGLNSIKIERKELLEKIRSGKIGIVIGTQALIQKDVRFKHLGLTIVDEQHRFGVNQRAYLQQNITTINDGLPGTIPHLLTMTATPIPRTLAMAFFGNLDLSVLDEMPRNRKPIITKIITPGKRSETYDFIRKEIASGRQAFIIFPLVEESEKLSELKAATQEHERLSRDVFPDLSLGLLHGKLKASDKESVMDVFKHNKYNILVATSVVEVGIDIPNATVIIIEDADRFGLSQLHQFRGRVGRGEHQSYCFLFSSSATVKSRTRLGAMEKTSDGFKIAEEDFKLRGPGEFLGTRQSGLPDIAMQHIANVKLIEISKHHAEQLLKKDSKLIHHPLLKKELERFQMQIHME